MITFRSMASEMALRSARVLHRLLGELEDPALGLDGGHVEHLHAAAALERLHQVGRDAVDHVDLAGAQPGRAGGELRDEAEGDLLDLRDARLPVARVGGQLDVVAVGPATRTGTGPVPIGFWKNASSFLAALGGSMPSMVRCAGSEPNGRFDVTMTA